MTYILKDGLIIDQTISEVEVDVPAEEYRLQAWKDALVTDERERTEYLAKLDEIDATVKNKEYAEKLKETVNFYSGSGITQKMVEEQQAKVDSLYELIK